LASGEEEGEAGGLEWGSLDLWASVDSGGRGGGRVGVEGGERVREVDGDGGR
jgi:hypothetical protein